MSYLDTQNRNINVSVSETAESAANVDEYVAGDIGNDVASILEQTPQATCESNDAFINNPTSNAA